MRVFKNLFGDGSKIHASEIVVGVSGNHRTLQEWMNPEHVRLGTVEEMDNFYGNYSIGMPARTYYNFCTSHQVMHPALGGGTFYLEGFKTNDLYEYQEIKSYQIDGIKHFVRSKYNGLWNDWVRK